MTKDKYGIEIKVGDFVLLDHGEGREYPNMNSGQMVQIKKIGSKRIAAWKEDPIHGRGSSSDEDDE